MIVAVRSRAHALCSFRVPLGPDFRQDDRFDLALVIKGKIALFKCSPGAVIPVETGTQWHLNEHSDTAPHCIGTIKIKA